MVLRGNYPYLCSNNLSFCLSVTQKGPGTTSQFKEDTNPIAYYAKYCYITGPLFGNVTGWSTKHLGDWGLIGIWVLKGNNKNVVGKGEIRLSIFLYCSFSIFFILALCIIKIKSTIKFQIFY